MKNITLIVEIAGRIKEERERLGYLQPEFAAQGAVARNSQSRYELGNGSPSADYLARIARLGADVQYIVTGVRSENLHEIDTAESSLLNIAEDGAKYALTTSKDLDMDLMNKIVQGIWAVILDNKDYETLPPKVFSKAVSIIYQNKTLSNSRTAPSVDTVRSVLDALIMVEIED
ncbi:helix-turn-helix domain-containing protein [Pseudohongiella sp.]|uniref:HTH cro/C1-type domain-containing protein n=1 Tax=marine sediment metagenome TaxID=412755 RepID=A0A0F9VS12_9ZZZZ|nr:helix-turn-helix transcriptional regulator [Pseudohongiella sp.]HDZ10046.1 XRE family transcriptional regulator [Pseudohongiella sp.]HEA63395.1 XRE family transcriptional regulator [Pseudohongiella sp.]